MYREKDGNTLIVEKKRLLDIPMNVLKEHKESYQNYIDNVVYDDLAYMAEAVGEHIGTNLRVRNIGITSRPDRLKENDGFRHNEYITIGAEFYNDKVSYFVKEAVRLGVMSSDGSINGKVMINELERMEQIYLENRKDGSSALKINLPFTTIPFAITKKNLIVWEGRDKLKLSMYDLLATLLNNEFGWSGEEIDRYLNDTFKNHYFVNDMNSANLRILRTSMENARNFASISATRTFSDYLKNSKSLRLGKTRRVLNETLTLEKALGHTLAEDVTLPSGITLRKGYLIRKNTIDRLESEGVNKIFIDYIPNLIGRKLENRITVEHLPKGLTLTPYVLHHLPEYAGYRYLPEPVDKKITINKTKPLTKQMLLFLKEAGVEQLYIKDCKYPYTFKHEVISNNTIPIKNLFPNGNIPKEILQAGYKRDDRVYAPAVNRFKSMIGKVLARQDYVHMFMPDYFTVDDIMSLLCYTAGTKNLPDVFETYNNDEDFLKKVNDISTIISKRFREEVNQFKVYRRSVLNEIFNCVGKTRPEQLDGYFYKFNESLQSRLSNSKLFQTAESTNPLTILSQSRRITTVLSNPPASVRFIVMGHFGRICPYDTPPSDKIGLANSMCVHTRVRDGLLETPYHPVYTGSDGRRYISREIVWFSQLEEINLRIGDIMLVDTEGDTFATPIVPKRINARIPHPNSKEEKITFGIVNSEDLDYVSVSANQTLSLTSTMIPLAGADDGVRLSYTNSMLKQAVYIEGSEVPRVLTSNYYRLFDEETGYVIRAPYDCEIVDILNNAVAIRDASGNVKNINVREITIDRECFTALDFKAKVGDYLKEGDIIADTTVSREGVFTPGTNVLVAYMPYYGYNNEDAGVMSSKTTKKFTSYKIKEIEKIVNKRDGFSYEIEKNTASFVRGGELLFKVHARNPVTKQELPPIEIRAPKNAEGILYRVAKTQAGEYQDTYTATLINKAIIKEGDKFTGRHGNKGTVALVEKNSLMPRLPNGETIDMCLNSCGIPSRMNPGQQLEGHLGLVAYLLDIRIQSDSFNGASREEVAELLEYVYDIAHFPFSQVESKWRGILPEFLIERGRARQEYISTWRGCINERGEAYLINPRTGKRFKNPITIGVSYILKLVHQSSSKMHSRSGGIGCNYVSVEEQPTKGSDTGGGQRIGEMEMDAINAYGATAIATEIMNEKSDNIERREYTYPTLLQEAPHRPLPIDITGTSPRVVEVFKYHVEGIGLEMDVEDGSDTDVDSVIHRARFDRKAIVTNDQRKEAEEIAERELQEILDMDF